jgi:copper chaperone CopZ
MKKSTFNVKDMHCVNCAMTLQGLEDDVPGISSVEASYHKQNMTVQYDETKVTVEQIIREAKRLGYTAELKE